MLVCPIIEYFSCLWGFDQFDEIYKITKRDVRFYLGLPIYASIAGMMGEMGWYPPYVNNVNIARMYNCMVQMPNS